MSRYRKSMRQAMEEGLSNMQIAILKKEYAPFKGKTISAARAKQLMNILDKFKEADLKKLGKETIPFVSSGARSKLAVRNMKFKVTTINPFKEEVTQEDFDLEEGKMKTIATMFSQGKSAEEIAKKMKLPVDTVKSILGEVNEGADTRELTNLYNKRTPLTPAEQKRKAELEKKLGVNEDLNQDDEKVIKKVKDMLKGASAKHAAQAKMIDKALKNEADLTKSQTKKVHDKADELPKKDFRDRYGKEKGDSVRYGVATKMVKKKLNIENKDHPAKDLYEQIKGLKNKAEKSGMPYSILKKVYDRGMAAWRGGHRPGTTQQQWAFARVNSFVTKSSGTWGGADKDLAKQVRGSK